ncbi:MAG: hypothetical protein IT233_03105 [Bacteroidia bacterium]|nr:hypothetical protein [Bacteroidia bacterium]
MKKTIIWTLALLMFGSIAIVSCSKYEEGPKISLRTRKGRLAGDWKLTEMLVNGTAVNLSGSTYELKIEKDGGYTMIMTVPVLGTLTDVGTWEFGDKKETLISTNSTGDKDTSTIVMLKNKMLKLKDESGGDVTITTYEQ